MAAIALFSVRGAGEGTAGTRTIVPVWRVATDCHDPSLLSLRPSGSEVSWPTGEVAVARLQLLTLSASGKQASNFSRRVKTLDTYTWNLVREVGV